MAKYKFRKKEGLFYKESYKLNTENYGKFLLSIFKKTPWYYWIFIIAVSLTYPYYYQNSSLFYPQYGKYPEIQLLRIYTVIVAILSPFVITYIKYGKRFSLYSIFYYFNSKRKYSPSRGYIIEHYKDVSYLKRALKESNGTSPTKGMLLYPMVLIFFMIIYLYIMFHVVVIALILCIVHSYYRYKNLKEKNDKNKRAF